MPLCKTLEDAAQILHAIAGYDELDPTTVNVPVSDYPRAIGAPVSKLRLGIPRAAFFDKLDPDVASAVEAGIAVLRKMTASAVDVKFPPSNLAVLGVEAYAYHAKYLAESPQLYQPQTRVGLLRAANVKAATYANALQQMKIGRRAIVSEFSNIDLLITPTMPDPPITIAEAKTENVSVRNTSPFDAFGLPAITVPCGFTKAGLPIGLQIAAAPWAESNVLALAHAYEQATDWHTRHPKL
ncbi:MAG: amidase [Bryobacteraceae bacterium]